MQADHAERQNVEVILYPDRPEYSVAESIRPKLEIRNRHEFPVQIAGGFECDWEQLAFTSPNAAHLFGPDGRDLLRPYQRPASFRGYGPSIEAEAGKSEWLFLPISSHIHLRQFGSYTFWLALLDSLGTLHRTNTIRFQLVDVEYSMAPEVIDLRIAAPQSAFAASEPIEMSTVFTNKSDQEIIFLTPQEDSLDGWVNPIYQFTVIDPEGRGLALARRSGTMATPVYDETTTVTVAPGQSFSLSLRLPVFPDMRQPGEYRVRLSYIVSNRAIGKGGDVLDEPMHWQPGVFIGRIESNEVVIQIT